MGKAFKWIKDYLGNRFYPYTSINAVYVDDNEQRTLADEISDLNDNVDNISKKQADWNELDTTKNTYIKNKPLSLPANGGNSDTLEGKHASDFTEKDVFTSHLSDNTAHQNLFDSKLNIDAANKLIKNISSDVSTGIITITRQDNTTFSINIPKCLILKSATFNEQSNEIIITWSDDSESKIPVDGLVDIYTGSEGNIIQIEVNDNNVISAIVKEGSVDENYLSQNVQNILDASNEHVSNAEKHIPNGGTSGQIIGMTDSGVEWIDMDTPSIKPDGETIVSNNGTISTKYIKTINIAEGTDLNTVLSPGFYCCQTTSIAKSLINCPVQTPFNMVVRYATGTAKSSAIQELTTYTVDNPKTYKRSVYHHNANDVHTIGNWCLIYDENNRPPETGLVSYFSIADLGLDSGSKYTIMEIFENMPSKCILYLGDCANVSDYPNMGALTPSVTINKLTLNACYAVAMSRSVGDGTFRMAYKILRNNDPKGETEWIEIYSEDNLTAEKIGALSITGGTLESNKFPLLNVKRTQSGQSATISFSSGDGELIMLEAVAANNEDHEPELWIRDRSDNTRLLHLSKKFKKIYDPKSNSLQEILTKGTDLLAEIGALPLTGGILKSNRGELDPVITLEGFKNFGIMDLQSESGGMRIQQGYDTTHGNYFAIYDKSDNIKNILRISSLTHEICGKKILLEGDSLPVTGGEIKSDKNDTLVISGGLPSLVVKRSTLDDGDACLDFSNNNGKCIRIQAAYNKAKNIINMRVYDIVNKIYLLAVSKTERTIYDYKTSSTKEIMVKGEATPIGTVHITVNNSNPSSLFGGTWESMGTMQQSGQTCYVWKRTN